MEYTATFGCPSAVSPNALRHGGITIRLNSDVPKDVVSGRANVTADVLGRHLHRRSQQQKMEQ
jgi:hypothetical protein